MKLVTTIIPAYNVASTLQRTLKSAIAQTYPLHEILVIDDGSNDATGQLADEIAARNPMVRVIHQDNRGLPGARNRGIDEAAGDFVAPLDADDVWHPEKIARQVAAIEAMPQAGLAYAWFRRIDGEDRVLPGSASPQVEGWVFHQHLARNFISNGSSPLIRTEIARTLRYDESFTSCEDYLFQLQVARQYRFACVPAYLTGYRLSANGMSRHVERMIRAHLRMFDFIRAASAPAARHIIDGRVAALYVELARNRIRRGHPAEAIRALTQALTIAPSSAIAAVVAQLRLASSRAFHPMFPPAGSHFDSYDATAHDGDWLSDIDPTRNARLAMLDAGGPAKF